MAIPGSMRLTWVLFALLFVCSLSYRKLNLGKISYSRSKSSLLAQKYDPATFIQVSLLKPLGLSLEEVVENGRSGVVIEEVGDGNAKTCGKLYKGLFLVSANGKDLKYEDFVPLLMKIHE